MMIMSASPGLRIGPSDKVFVLTGAGISAESGIPTFRDANGLWCGYRVEDVASPGAWARNPQLVWRFYSMRRRGALTCKPNAGHVALAALEHELDDRFFLCTQNVDNLHEQAGSRRLVHMHGELLKSRCDSCDRQPFEDTALFESTVPRCECGGQLRPHIVWFGEMPLEMERIAQELERCTMMLVIGTSGLVYPAAGFVSMVRERQASTDGGVRTIYVGPEEPANSRAFDQCCLGTAAQVLPGLITVD